MLRANNHVLAFWTRPHHCFVKIHIILRTLITIAALILLPLMAWHQASSRLVDALGMPHIWVEDFQRTQDYFVTTWLWVFLWVLVSVDFWHALYCLGDDRFYGKHSAKSVESILKLRGPILLFLYDTLLTLILALYIFDFAATINTLAELCNASKTKDIPIWSLELAHQREPEDSDIHPEEYVTLSAQERCLRLTGTILIAGGFAGGVAAILATLHLASILCRACETCYIWVARRKPKPQASRNFEFQGADPDWRNPPRDVDIHMRATREGGLLTGISEEEQTTGVEVRRRRQANTSKHSGSVRTKTSSALGKLEDVLLECLVP